ncbi:MAG: hypothetical protein HYW26_02345 [Candidatus Aenigmarchaeota archaeon]|nr:hypothetical protein [Candidatus Aenigmarchaeota archaeon]
MEETGCKIKVISEVGKIIEHRTHMNLLQTSYCYIAKVTEKRQEKFDKGEVKHGFKLGWVEIDFAAKILKKEKPQDYEGRFIVLRDLKFIETAEGMM